MFIINYSTQGAVRESLTNEISRVSFNIDGKSPYATKQGSCTGYRKVQQIGHIQKEGSVQEEKDWSKEGSDRGSENSSQRGWRR